MKTPKRGGINYCLINDFTKHINTKERKKSQDGGALGTVGFTVSRPLAVVGFSIDGTITASGPPGVGWAMTTPSTSTSCSIV